MQAFAAQLDDIGKPAWIALTVVSFILFWPLGLLVLGFLIGSGRMACWTHGGTDRWQRRMERMQRRMQRMQSAAERWGCGSYRTSSGNYALTSTAPKPCAVSKKSSANSSTFLHRLRHAKDKAEFDQFMAEHRRPSNGPGPQSQTV